MRKKRREKDRNIDKKEGNIQTYTTEERLWKRATEITNTEIE